MRVLIAGVLGGLAMYVWASVAHLSPLATIGTHVLPNESVVVGVLRQNLGAHGGVYIFPSPPAGQTAPAAAAQGMLAYGLGSGALTPRQLGVEFGLEVVESLLMALIAAIAGGGFGDRVRIAALVGLIAGMATNVSYWNWYGFGLDYTLANGFIEVMKFVVAGLVIAAILRRKPAAA
jgi:hypothetical protein